MSGGVNAGRDNKLYINATPEELGVTMAAANFDLVDRVSDVDRAGSKATTEVDMRASETTIVVYGNKSREITFTYYKRRGASDAVYNALLDSFENNTVLDTIMAEGLLTVAGTVYDRGPFVVAEMSKSEPISGVEAYEVTMNFADAVIAATTNPFLYLTNQVVPGS